MRSGDVALRFSIVFAVAGFITIAAGIYEIDRREKSSSETITANLTEIEQRVRILSDQIRILNDQYTRQINANERELHALGIQNQALESRLNEVEDHVRVRRESAPVRRQRRARAGRVIWMSHRGVIFSAARPGGATPAGCRTFPPAKFAAASRLG